MSLLPANELHVMLAPDGFHAARARWHWQGVPRQTMSDPVREPGTSWAGALSALEALLRAQDRPPRLYVTLSNRLVRYALVPWQAGLGGAAAQAYQRDCFVRLYGDRAMDWHVAAAPPTRHAPGLASAVDTALVSELQALCQRTGTRLLALQPQLAAVVNRWRRTLRGDCFWLALAEPGCLCVALAQRRAWRVIRTARTGDEPLAALPALLERETLLADTDAVPAQVYLWAPALAADGVDELGGLPAIHLETGRPLAAAGASQ
ncbi:MAG: hypothetical protein ACXWC4_02535 [Telluria sp.]